MDTKELLIELLLEKHSKKEEKAEQFLKSEMIGKICMVRTYSAGVFYGEIVAKAGKEVRMKDARRVWYWSGAASLSQLAMEGTKDADNCKFPCKVDSLELDNVIEVIAMTEGAIKSLNGVKIWQK